MNKVVNSALLFAICIHAAFVGLFMVLSAPAVAALHALGVVAMFIALGLSWKGRVDLALHLGTVDVLCHSVANTWFVGWESAFHLYLATVITVGILVPVFPMRIRVGWSLASALCWVGVTVMPLFHAPTHAIEPSLLYGIGALNAAGSAAVLIGVNLVYVRISGASDRARREAERALRQTVRRNHATLEHMADGLFSVDADGNVVTMNPSMSYMLAVRRSQASEDPTRIPEVLLQLARDAIRDDRVMRIELELPGQGVGAAVASPLRAEPGEPPEGAVVLVRDITVDKEVDRMKTEFTSTVSHELRTPMTSVMGFSRIIKNRLEERILPNVVSDDPRVAKAIEQVRSNLDIMLAESERLTDLIGDVLDIAKMEAGQIHFQREALAPEAIVRRAREASAGLFVGTEVVLQAEAEEGLPTVLGDANRLHQVVVNLISNAAKFTEEGSVTVRAARIERGVRFSVTDTGPGIPLEDQPAVFDRFQQLGEIDTTKPRGSGLGLAICRQIVEAHDGSIRVESELGEGATFSFDLPVSE